MQLVKDDEQIQIECITIFLIICGARMNFFCIVWRLFFFLKNHRSALLNLLQHRTHFEHVVQSLYNTSFGSPLLDLHPIPHRSKRGA